jgi:hypothetical protein
MAGANYPGIAVGKQDGRTIRRQDAKGNSWYACGQTVRFRRGIVRPRLLHDDDICAMNLIRRYQRLGWNVERAAYAAPVLGDVGWIIVGAVSAIQRLVQPTAHAALAGEKSMLRAFRCGQCRRFDHWQWRHSLRHQ